MSSLSEALWEDVPEQALGQGDEALMGPEGPVGRLLIRGEDGDHKDPVDWPEQWSVKATPSLAPSTALTTTGHLPQQPGGF